MGLHMHGLDLPFVDETHITQRWTMYRIRMVRRWHMTRN